MTTDPKKPVRDWMNSNPVWSMYIAFVVTLLLIIKLVELVGLI
jgi:hypothetical protein